MTQFERIKTEGRIEFLQSFLSEYAEIGYQANVVGDYEREAWALDYYHATEEEIESLRSKL